MQKKLQFPSILKNAPVCLTKVIFQHDSSCKLHTKIRIAFSNLLGPCLLQPKEKNLLISSSDFISKVLVPDNGSSIARIKGEFDEALAEEYGHEITIRIILVPIIQDEAIGGGRSNHQFKVVPQRRLLAQSREYQVRGLSVKRRDLKLVYIFT